ncbi:hypothetical protein SKAU_G00230950 [Synaphobranchus kaupii]|uniref:Uncharacterized protein n=2 Tax=Anguilliformes TaxID=7933 RepID=A0A9Q1F5N6_SYNKA|nr:hypothetical protein SKAU_G00230950 [Synaphobranchus kaupii]
MRRAPVALRGLGWGPQVQRSPGGQRARRTAGFGSTGRLLWVACACERGTRSSVTRRVCCHHGSLVECRKVLHHVVGSHCYVPTLDLCMQNTLSLDLESNTTGQVWRDSGMSLRRGPCLWTPIPQSDHAPCDRYKHSCCAQGDSVYLLGGRGKTQRLLNDFWRYNVVRNEWTELDCSCENAPEEMEEHSMVNYQGLLYIFGGMIDSGYSGNKIPLWLYSTDKEDWQPRQGKNTYSQKLAPVNRKGHSAVVFDSSMYVYGGYIDMKGSSQEFWRLDFDTGAWSDLTPDEAGPGPRHGHSAATHLDCMYLFGGLTGLREQSDLWRWSFSTLSWSSIRSLSGPSKLVGHSAVVYQDNMLLFGGGGTQSSPRNSLWRFSFLTQVWERLAAITSNSPPCKMHHCIAGLGPSYRPQPQSSHTPPGEVSPGRPRLMGARLRPFKNKCFPTEMPTEGSIELETFRVDSQRSAAQHCSGSRAVRAETCAHPSTLRGTCLTFENQEAFSKGWSCADSSGTEDVTFHLPDLLLVLGGRPMGANPGISMWQLTLTDL